MIGLVGANGVGKTTLAREFGKEQNVTVLETSTSAVYAAIGYNPAVDYDLGTRLAIQMVILDALTKQYEAATRTSTLWISDRTPIDLATYMLADVMRSSCNGNPELSAAVVDYVDKCFALANRFFSIMVLVQPGIVTPTDREGKAPGHRAYQEHFNHLAFGLLMDQRMGGRHFFLKREVLDLQERKKSLFNAVTSSIQKHKELMETLTTVAH